MQEDVQSSGEADLVLDLVGEAMAIPAAYAADRDAIDVGVRCEVAVLVVERGRVEASLRRALGERAMQLRPSARIARRWTHVEALALPRKEACLLAAQGNQRGHVEDGRWLIR